MHSLIVIPLIHHQLGQSCENLWLPGLPIFWWWTTKRHELKPFFSKCPFGELHPTDSPHQSRQGAGLKTAIAYFLEHFPT